MYSVMLAILNLAPATAATDASSEDIGRTATECAAFYSSFRSYVARTDEEKKSVKEMQNFMTTLAKENGTSQAKFVEIWVPYQRELNRRAPGDAAYVQSQLDRCSEFAKREVKKRDASTHGGG